jgi:hypothetical protein
MSLIVEPIEIGNQPIYFEYSVIGKTVKKLHLEIECKENYANLSLSDGQNMLLDNLDIPKKGNFSFEVLIDFGSTGLKKLQWLKSGGSIILKKVYFTEVNDFDIPVFKDISEESGLISELSWKYGGPTIADIDNNGYYDLILNNHDKTPTKLFLQKEKGKLTQQEIFPSISDFHGTTAADFDNDGDLDIINSRGGGNGTTPAPPFFLRNDDGKFNSVAEEIGITEGARGRSVRAVDMDLDGDLDLLCVNAKGINSSDSVQHIFYKNTGKGKFERVRSANIENADAERVLVTDLNNDNIDDLVMYSPISIWLGNDDLPDGQAGFTFTDVSKKWLSSNILDSSSITGIVDIDLDNDGDLDLYLSRGKPYYEMANKSLDFNPNTGRIDIRDEGNKAITSMEFDADGAITVSDIFLWYRLYDGGFPMHLGHSKDTFNLKENEKLVITQKMANGWANERNENGWYIGYIGNGKWKMEWVRNKPIYWGVRISIEGLKNVTPIGWKPQNRNLQDILLVNDNEKLTDVSEKWNIPKGGNHWGVTVGDFNNDSYNDLYIYRFGFLKTRITDWLLLNTGQGRFEITTSHEAKDRNDKGHGDMGQAFDFDLDGKVDLLNGSDDYGKWYLYGNQTQNENNYIIARIGNSPKSNIDAYSAVVTIETANHTYRKRVGSAGEIHSQSLLNAVHFGLGKVDNIKKITVRWRNGEEVILENVKANQLYDFPKNTDDLDFSKMMKGVSADNILYDTTDYYNWGSSIVKGEDGKYHLFYAQMPRDLGFSTWLNDGIISRAVANQPEGPYVRQETILKGRGFGYWDETTAHNPWIQKYNGKYYLYYMSSNYGGRKLNADELHQARTKWIDNEFRALVRENQRIGVAVSESVFGPWERLDKPIVEPKLPITNITCNPAVTQRPDGGYLMLIRGDMPDTTELVRHQAVGLSPTPIGPWEIQAKAAVSYMNAEDPAIWYDKKRERYYAIYHGFGYMGLITSTDGLNWKKAKHYKIMELAYKNDKGEMVKVARMERPFLYLEDGVPKVLTVSIQLDSGESYSMFIPLKF